VCHTQPIKCLRHQILALSRNDSFVALRWGYINAEFEYSMPGTLDLCEEDELVIHPIFSGQRKSTAWDKIGSNIIGVYPHDADPDEMSDRELIKDQFLYN
jgi:hypothetical protein